MVRAIACCVLSLVVVSIPPAPARADQAMVLQARLAQSVMKAGTAQRNYLRIGLNGCERPPSERTPVNVAFVIDRSGSMQGDAYRAGTRGRHRRRPPPRPDDIASVVIFDDKSTCWCRRRTSPTMPPSPTIRQVGRARHDRYLCRREGRRGRGRSNQGRRDLNRVVLLSDGHANVGPRRPAEFAELGRDAGRGHLGQHHRPRPAIQRGPDAEARARE